MIYFLSNSKSVYHRFSPLLLSWNAWYTFWNWFNEVWEIQKENKLCNLCNLKISLVIRFFKLSSFENAQSSQNIFNFNQAYWLLTEFVNLVGHFQYCPLKNLPHYLHKNIELGMSMTDRDVLFDMIHYKTSIIWDIPSLLRFGFMNNNELIFSSSRKNFANFRQSSLDGMTSRSYGSGLSRARPSNRWPPHTPLAYNVTLFCLQRDQP